MKADTQWFRDARFGLMIHYGLYSLLGRGEWVMNREAIPKKEYAKLADRFTAEKFNADDIVRRAKEWGMRYVVFTCKHHEGFCLYDSRLTGFTSVKTFARRDLVAEIVAACRKHGLRIGLYHSLNDWSANPDAVDALERPDECYQKFIDYVHGQIREIMTNYGKVDVMWYDGWWPFDGRGWQAEKLNAIVRQLQPGILLNGRCGIKGDFDTPEKHIQSSPGLWEACAPMSDNWSYHPGDSNWISAKEIAEMLRRCAASGGNLLLNIGPMADGTVPPEAAERMDQVGKWLAVNGEAIYNTEKFECRLREQGDARGEWSSSGGFTASVNNFYWHLRCWPGAVLALAGIKCKVLEVTDLSTGKKHPFRQEGERVSAEGFPERRDMTMPVVIRFRTAGKPLMYLCGGHRAPNVPHCHYDPVASDLPE